MNLPEIPKLANFPGDEYGYNKNLYLQALNAWERICTKLIENEQKKPQSD